MSKIRLEIQLSNLQRRQKYSQGPRWGLLPSFKSPKKTPSKHRAPTRPVLRLPLPGDRARWIDVFGGLHFWDSNTSTRIRRTIMANLIALLVNSHLSISSSSSLILKIRDLHNLSSRCQGLTSVFEASVNRQCFEARQSPWTALGPKQQLLQLLRNL